MPITRNSIFAVTMAALLAACSAPSASGRAVSCPEAPVSPVATPPYDDDPELAARLPTEIAGQELAIQSVCATSANPGGLNLSPEFLEAAGVELDDVTIAVSQPPSIGQDQPFVTISAFRYRGADEASIRAAFVETFTSAGLEVREETIAGKEVVWVLVVAWYVADDTLYAITGEAPQVEEILQALP